MERQTYGGTKAAENLADLIDHVPPHLKQAIQRRVSKPLHSYFRGLHLIDALPDKNTRNQVIGLCRKWYFEHFEASPHLKDFPTIMTHAQAVVVTAARKIIRGSEERGAVPRTKHGKIDAPDEICDGFLICGFGPSGKILTADSVADLRGIMGSETSRVRNFPPILLDIERWAMNAYPGERLVLPGTVIVAIAGDVTEMHSMYKQLRAKQKTLGEPDAQVDHGDLPVG